jgi:hypothetical protein
VASETWIADSAIKVHGGAWPCFGRSKTVFPPVDGTKAAILPGVYD